MCDLGALNEQLDLKIRIYKKNGVGKCYFRTKKVTGTKSMLVNGKDR